MVASRLYAIYIAATARMIYNVSWHPAIQLSTRRHWRHAWSCCDGGVSRLMMFTENTSIVYTSTSYAHVRIGWFPQHAYKTYAYSNSNERMIMHLQGNKQGAIIVKFVRPQFTLTSDSALRLSLAHNLPYDRRCQVRDRFRTPCTLLLPMDHGQTILNFHSLMK